MKSPDTLEKRVLRFIQANGLTPTPPKLVVAVSGGADSVCLLHILAGLKGDLGLELHAAHLNHKLRGDASDADARYAAALAKGLNIPITVKARDVSAHRAATKLSLEEAARRVRYGFLQEITQAVGAGAVAVGHTQNDHIETMLLHLVRGTGLRGLTGLKSRTCLQTKGGPIDVIRPLLETTRHETEAYCLEHNLEPRLDASNRSLSPLRNRIRHQLVPLMKQYNPRATEALIRTARSAAEDFSFIEAECRRLWEQIAAKHGDKIMLNKEGILEAPPALRRYLLQMAVETLKGDARDIQMCHIEDMMAVLMKGAGKRVSLPSGLSFATEHDRYILSLGEDTPLPLEGEHALNIPGETSFSGWLVTASVVKGMKMLAEDGLTAYLDMDKTGDHLIVRHRRRGDRFQPLGMGETKKVSEFMIDTRIPQPQRDSIPLVCSGDNIVWVVGSRIDERAKVTSQTKRVLSLSFKRA